MIYHGVTCERVPPPIPEAYVCASKDANTLALGLLSEGKGRRMNYHGAQQGEKGIYAKPFAILTVEPPL